MGTGKSEKNYLFSDIQGHKKKENDDDHLTLVSSLSNFKMVKPPNSSAALKRTRTQRYLLEPMRMYVLLEIELDIRQLHDSNFGVLVKLL